MKIFQLHLHLSSIYLLSHTLPIIRHTIHHHFSPKNRLLFVCAKDNQWLIQPWHKQLTILTVSCNLLENCLLLPSLLGQPLFQALMSKSTIKPNVLLLATKRYVYLFALISLKHQSINFPWPPK